jgi:hypothetical protein
MAAKRILRGWDDDSQSIVRNLAEVLETLSRYGCDLEAGRLWFEVPPTMSPPALVARLLFSATRDNIIDVQFDLPMFHGVKARTTLGAPRNLPVEALEGAKPDSLGNVTLADGTSIHAVNFDLVEFPGPWTDLDEAIIWLTIRAFGKPGLFLRRHFFFRRAEDKPRRYRWVGIDYGLLHTMRVPNVKILTRYINAHIGKLPRKGGLPRFAPVPISRVRQTLSIAGVGKVRGHKRRQAAPNISHVGINQIVSGKLGAVHAGA